MAAPGRATAADKAGRCGCAGADIAAAGGSGAGPQEAGGLGGVLSWAKLAAARLGELDSDDDRIAALAAEEAASRSRSVSSPPRSLMHGGRRLAGSRPR